MLQVFNSRTCQLVLGAGAMATAGLKSISAKHLALCNQCLGALIHLHPALAAALAAHVPPLRQKLLQPELHRLLQVRFELLKSCVGQGGGMCGRRATWA